MIIQLGAAFHQSIFIGDCINKGFQVLTIDNRPENYGHRLSTSSMNISFTETGLISSVINIEKDIISSYGSDVGMLTWLEIYNTDPWSKQLRKLCTKSQARGFLRDCFEDNCEHIQPKITLWESLSEKDIDIQTELVVVKPNISSGSKGVSVMRRDSINVMAYEHAKDYSTDNRVVIEEYVENDGCKYFCEGLKVGKSLIFVFGLSTSSRDNLFYDGSLLFTEYNCGELTGVGYKELYMRLESSIRSIMAKLFEGEVGPSFAFNVDFYLTQGKLFIIEFTSRPGGNFLSLYLEYTYDVDYTETLLSILNPFSEAKICYGQARFTKRVEKRPVRLSLVHDKLPASSIYSFPTANMPSSHERLSMFHA